MYRNGLGPFNKGSMTGKGYGFCNNENSSFSRQGAFGRRQGFGRGFRQRNFNFERNIFLEKDIDVFIGARGVYEKKEYFKKQKAYYEKELEKVEKELEKLK